MLVETESATDIYMNAAALILLSAVAAASPRPSVSDTTRICLAPTTVEANAGGVAAIVDAVRESFTSFLTGPTLQAKPLTARLQSQAREEAK